MLGNWDDCEDQQTCGGRKIDTLPPALDTSPAVGLIPARLLLLDGQVMLPSVSVPRETAVKPIDEATPEPEDDPQGPA